MPIPVIAQRGQIWNSVLLFPGGAPRLGSYGGACRPSLVRCPRARPPCCALSCAELLSPECPEVRKKADSPDSVTPCFWLFRGCFWLFLAVSGLFWAVLGCFSLLFAVFAVLSRLFGCSRLFMAGLGCWGLLGAVFGRFRPFPASRRAENSEIRVDGIFWGRKPVVLYAHVQRRLESMVVCLSPRGTSCRGTPRESASLS